MLIVVVRVLCQERSILCGLCSYDFCKVLLLYSYSLRNTLVVCQCLNDVLSKQCLQLWREAWNGYYHKQAIYFLNLMSKNVHPVLDLVLSCDDDDNHDDDDEFFLLNGWPTKGFYALFLVVTIVKDSCHRKSWTRHEQSLNLRGICV